VVMPAQHQPYLPYFCFGPDLVPYPKYMIYWLFYFSLQMSVGCNWKSNVITASQWVQQRYLLVGPSRGIFGKWIFWFYDILLIWGCNGFFWFKREMTDGDWDATGFGHLFPIWQQRYFNYLHYLH
jgi:hypothetical protein